MKTVWMVPATTAVAAALTAAHLWGVPYSMPADLLAKTVLAMGGNGNTNGLLMENELAGYIDPTNANCRYCADDGYVFKPATWNATVWAVGSDFDRQQADGVRSLDAQLRETLAENPGDSVVVVGYSSSADVVIREMRALQAQRDSGDPEALDPNVVSFLVMGNPNRPNGGILARFPPGTVPILGVTVGGSNPDTDYELTDITWEYDLASDAPAYLNPLSFANAVIGFFYQHSFYYGADPNDPDAVIFDETDPDTGTRYITISAKHLALLQPLYDVGVPGRLLDSVEPALEVLIDLGYDRESMPWELTPLQLAPPPERFVAAVPELQQALREGAEILLGQREAPSDSDDDSVNATWAVIENVLGGVLKDFSWDTITDLVDNILNPNRTTQSSTGNSLMDISSIPRASALTLARGGGELDAVAKGDKVAVGKDKPVRQAVSQLRNGIEDAAETVRDGIEERADRPVLRKKFTPEIPVAEADSSSGPDAKPKRKTGSDIGSARADIKEKVAKRAERVRDRVDRVRDRTTRAETDSRKTA